MCKLAFVLGCLAYSFAWRRKHVQSLPDLVDDKVLAVEQGPAFNPVSISRSNRATQSSVALGSLKKMRRLYLLPEMNASSRRMNAKPVMIQTKLEPFIKQIMDIQAKALGPVHPGTLKSKSLFAKELQGREDWKGAEKLQREIFKARLRQLGPADQQTLTAENDLARSVLALGDVDEAERLCLEALEARTEMLGPEHQDTLTSKHDLAQILWERGDQNSAMQAVQMHNETYSARLRTLGLIHPDTLTSASIFADILDSLGEEKKAKRLRSDVILQGLVGSVEEEEAISLERPKHTEIASHMQLDLDEDGQPSGLRFVYVDERKCIGCTFCASEAQKTFVMEPDAGRARVFAQGQDPDKLEEAIDCCPVNCIHYVDLEDLVILETERSGRKAINPMSIAFRGDPDSSRALPTKAKLEAMEWEHPEYRKKMEDREERKKTSAQAAQDELEEQTQEIVNEIMGSYSDDDSFDVADPAAAAESKELSIDQMKSIFGYSDSALPDDPAEPAHTPSNSLPSKEELAALFAASGADAGLDDGDKD
jgi:ferredoxin